MERVKQERIIKCNEAIENCQQRIENNTIRYKEIVKDFFDKAIMTILAVMPGYDDLYAQFPESQIIDPLRQLSKYKLNWRADRILSRTRELWAVNRPCVVEEKEKNRKKIKRNRIKRGILFAAIVAGAIVLVVGLLFIFFASDNSKSAESENKPSVETSSGQSN